MPFDPAFPNTAQNLLRAAGTYADTLTTAEATARAAADTSLGARVTALETGVIVLFTTATDPDPDPADYPEGTIWIQLGG